MTIRIGTDCSGLDSPILALNKLKIKFDYIFASEIEYKLRNNIIKLYKPTLIFDDIITRNHKQLPNIDLYISGFPCPSFSSASMYREGFNSIRGTIFFHCYSTIKYTKPKYFILENVKGLLTHNKGETLAIIKQYLKKLKDYTIYYEIINSKYFTPQNRTRIYIIGIKHKTKNYNFNNHNTNHAHIKNIIDTKNKKQIILSHNKQTLLNEIIIKKNINHKDWWIINLNTSSINYATACMNLSPTILTSSQMYYIIPLKRFLTINELQKLQGLQKIKLDFLTKTEQYRSIGNAMTVDVIAHIINILLH
jgi:DNA (cytosine-5)-methyltransferase 1